MKFPSVFTAEFWVGDHPDEVHYDHRPNVVLFPSAHARANAAQAALSLEETRQNMRDDLRADLMRQLRENREEHEMLQNALDDLDRLDAIKRKT